MSTQWENICTIHQRFREERDRLGLSQAALATWLTTSERTVKNYESGETSPKAKDLQRFAEQGADVLYIVTGERQPPKVGEPVATYGQPGPLAARIGQLKLSDTDAELLLAVAERLAGPGRR